ncbi:hypothetical protein F3Y22_tig00111303pilonHSYRG00011 [Hibiscus syriacus]|uniref:Uncharacterized protein n=1 Tax=Hibiscus syriacus TaxID=106335 RepID=A0A6A2YRA5_HIBSY|nr:hypothetical protein F3Y22_tig00111303pilonHSYRG00011 [Hibiscus syriacus]
MRSLMSARGLRDADISGLKSLHSENKHNLNIRPIIDSAKDDPFLRLMDDRKLQAVNTEPDHPTNVYGSKEDDAFKLSTIQELLLNEFLPDDVCPLDAHFSMDAPHKVYQAGPEDNKSIEVVETAYQFGRSPISTGPDLSYKEIAHHYKALVTRKQQKMSPLMSTRVRQESLISLSFQHPDNMTKQGPKNTDGLKKNLTFAPSSTFNSSKVYNQRLLPEMPLDELLDKHDVVSAFSLFDGINDLKDDIFRLSELW